MITNKQDFIRAFVQDACSGPLEVPTVKRIQTEIYGMKKWLDFNGLPIPVWMLISLASEIQIKIQIAIDDIYSAGEV